MGKWEGSHGESELEMEGTVVYGVVIGPAQGNCRRVLVDAELLGLFYPLFSWCMESGP